MGTQEVQHREEEKMSIKTIIGIVLLAFVLTASGCAVYGPGRYPGYGYQDDSYYNNRPHGYYGYGPSFSFGYFGGDSDHGGYYHHGSGDEREHFEHH
jgi:hypothetical protein